MMSSSRPTLVKDALHVAEAAVRSFNNRVRLRTTALGPPLVDGTLWLRGSGRLTLGRDVQLVGGAWGIELQVAQGGSLDIGDQVSVGAGTSIEATDRIAIGQRVRIGRFCKILDNHQHQLHGARHQRPASVPLVIEDDVVIEDFAIILAGAHIGRGARIGRGAIASRRVPAGAQVRAQAVHAVRERLLEGAAPVFATRAQVIEIASHSLVAWAARLGALGGPRTERDARVVQGSFRRANRAPADVRSRWSETMVRQLHVAARIMRARVELRACELGVRVRTSGRIECDPGGGRLVIGNGTAFCDGPQQTQLIAGPGHTLRIGHCCVLNYGSRVDARAASITLGDNCLLASGIQLLTSWGKPIVIEDNVWIAHGAVIEPGSRVGAGSVIGAGAVVSGTVPPRSLVMGNPGRAMSLDLRAAGNG